MELIGLWLGLSAALLYGSAFGVYLSLKTNWVKEVRRVQERLKDDHVKQGEGAEGPQRVENDA
jgi:MATE family multidrug resistance protein